MDIKPSRMLYYIPFLILVIGGYFFYYSLMDTLNEENVEIENTDPEIYKFFPGEYIIIDVLEEEVFFIMMEPISRDDIHFYSLENTTTMQLYSGDSVYEMDFFIYEQNDNNNIIYFDDVFEGLEIDGYDAISVVIFEEPGTYVIQTINVDDDFPMIIFAVKSERTPSPSPVVIDPTIGIFVLTAALAIVAFIPIYSKRKKAIKEYDESPYRSYDRTKY